MAGNDTASTPARTVIAVADAAAMAKAAADRVLARIDANPGRAAICLSGGSSPKQLYELLATDAYKNRIPWDRVHWFIGDDRFVPATDPLNNMSMARRAFLDRLAAAGTVHPIATDAASPHEAAQRYEAELRAFYGADRLDPAKPLFDVVLLGAGPDGHTASLFPGYPATLETERWVIEVPKANVEPFVPRVTLSFAALESCREMLFEASGGGKRAIITRILAGEDLPAGRAHSMGGATVWLADTAALPENFRG
jgi:6-phosphogluconolactonase